MSKKLLVIEDDEDSRQLMEQILSMSGHEVMSAASLEEAKEAIQQTVPDIILTDLQVPGVRNDGEIIQVLREMVGESSQIILLSGSVKLREIARTFKVRFLPKPFDLDQLLKVVE